MTLKIFPYFNNQCNQISAYQLIIISSKTEKSFSLGFGSMRLWLRNPWNLSRIKNQLQVAWWALVKSSSNETLALPWFSVHLPRKAGWTHGPIPIIKVYYYSNKEPAKNTSKLTPLWLYSSFDLYLSLSILPIPTIFRAFDHCLALNR